MGQPGIGNLVRDFGWRCVYVYIYIYIEREREREKEKETERETERQRYIMYTRMCAYIYIYIYIIYMYVYIYIYIDRGLALITAHGTNRCCMLSQSRVGSEPTTDLFPAMTM